MDENKTTVAEEEKETETPAAEAAPEEQVASGEDSEDASSEIPKGTDEETDEETSEDNTSTEDEKKPHKKAFWALIICAAVIILCAAVILGAGLIPQYTEAGDSVTLRAEKLPLISDLYTVDSDLTAIDTGTVGTHKVKLLLFGKIPLNATVTVRDTTPPSVFLFEEVLIPRNTLPSPSDFIRSVKDSTAVQCEFSSAPDTAADGSVEIIVTDEGKNEVTVTGRYRVSDTLTDRSFEHGITSDFVAARLTSLFEIDALDLTGVDFNTCGSYRAWGYFDGMRCAIGVNIDDTTPPLASVHSFDLLLGQSVDVSEIITDIEDISKVSVKSVPELDFSKIGHTAYEMLLEDEYGNTSSYTANINVHDVKSGIVVEAGTSAEEFADTVSILFGTGDGFPWLPGNFDPKRLDIGTYKTELLGKYSLIPFEITVEDTIPPEFSLRKLTVYIGTVPSPEDLVVECKDATDVSYEFEYTPDVSKPGSLLVTVIATDAAGNTATRSTALKVSEDNVPPVIYGVKAITAYEGDTVSFKSGVYAVDDKDGRLSVKADTSAVNIYAPGTYYVTYTVSDAEGNTASATAPVTIKSVTAEAVNERADKVLAEIITPYMNETEKARAIYDWCRKNLKYSTITSYLMGYFNKAAYSGFTKHYGNCYTYYAVASALLTRVGIENTVIQRNDPKNPHYWNLVKIGGSWYHLDTCPQPSPHKLEVFLLTDSQLKTFTLDYYYKFAAGVYPATP